MKINLVSFAVAALVTLSNCRPKKTENPQKPNENELITTLILELQNENNENDRKRVFSFRDLDGEGGNPGTFVIDSLDENTSYLGKIILLDETKAEVDTVSNGILGEKEEHQFFFRTFPSSRATFSYLATDRDQNGVPFGMFPKLETHAAGLLTFEIELRHQPNNLKPKSGNGDPLKGDVDVKVLFNDVKVLAIP